MRHRASATLDAGAPETFDLSKSRTRASLHQYNPPKKRLWHAVQLVRPRHRAKKTGGLSGNTPACRGDPCDAGFARPTPLSQRVCVFVARIGITLALRVAGLVAWGAVVTNELDDLAARGPNGARSPPERGSGSGQRGRRGALTQAGSGDSVSSRSGQDCDTRVGA